MDDVKDAILLDPCLMRFNHNGLVVLWTDFRPAALALLFANREKMTVPKRLWLRINQVPTTHL